MTDVDKVDQDQSDAPSPDVTPWQGVERRRPGRSASVSPELIPLLRGAVDNDFAHDDSTPIRGIATSVALSVVLLTVLGLAARSVIKYYAR